MCIQHLHARDVVADFARVSSGPKIDFRGGRTDAKVANAPGVPQPFQDLQSHIANFARQGFDQTEMIALVACGHTFGGVQHSAFPAIVPAQPGTDDVDATFDSTPFNFDNAMYVLSCVSSLHDFLLRLCFQCCGVYSWHDDESARRRTQRDHQVGRAHLRQRQQRHDWLVCMRPTPPVSILTSILSPGLRPRQTSLKRRAAPS